MTGWICCKERQKGKEKSCCCDACLRRSRLYAPPYLFLCAAKAVISGIQLAKTAYTVQRKSTHVAKKGKEELSRFKIK